MADKQSKFLRVQVPVLALPDQSITRTGEIITVEHFALPQDVAKELGITEDPVKVFKTKIKPLIDDGRLAWLTADEEKAAAEAELLPETKAPAPATTGGSGAGITTGTK